MAGSRAAGRPFLTVVTGVPRSGTSLVMQMLASGGMPVTTDDVRPPDESNPRGYFECEAVKGLGHGRDLRGELRDMTGTAVKVVAPLVLRLPAGPPYRVLLVRRDVAAVIESQRRMMARNGIDAPADDDASLARAILATCGRVRCWAAADPRTALLELDHADLLRRPWVAGAAIDEFLGGGLDVHAIAAAVDPALHRCRGSAGRIRGTPDFDHDGVGGGTKHLEPNERRRDSRLPGTGMGRSPPVAGSPTPP